MSRLPAGIIPASKDCLAYPPTLLIDLTSSRAVSAENIIDSFGQMNRSELWFANGFLDVSELIYNVPTVTDAVYPDSIGLTGIFKHVTLGDKVLFDLCPPILIIRLVDRSLPFDAHTIPLDVSVNCRAGFFHSRRRPGE
ncbi:MAG: hypothetical protein VX294_04635 [Candidatus Latescibacterota bacterium]|nr:hypothetical protein [Candidatus Latescibacterota bacterium]